MTLSRQFLLVLVLLTTACTTTADQEKDIDPWEPMNRRLFAVNETLDKYLLKPVTNGYRFVMPDPAERGVTNFIANIYEFNTVINSVLQGRLGNAMHGTGRFLVNSTVGIAGLFDVASKMGIPRQPADFGQTLATWGFESGPFVMLPVIGPRTVRSTAGYVVDTYSSIPALIDDTELAYTFWTLEVIDIRSRLMNAEDMISGDRYIFVRDAYLQRRAVFLNDGVVTDSFFDSDDDEDWDDY